MQLQIILDVDEGDPSVDRDHDTGLTEDAFNRLTSPGSLSWLGEVQSVEVIRGTTE